MASVFILAQQVSPAVMPPRQEAAIVIGVLVGALVIFAVAMWWLSYGEGDVRLSIHLHDDVAERLGLEALTEAPQRVPVDLAAARAARDLRIHQALVEAREPVQTVVRQ